MKEQKKNKERKRNYIKDCLYLIGTLAELTLQEKELRIEPNPFNIPKQAFISNIKIDMTESFKYTGFSSLDNIKYNTTNGTLEWIYDELAVSWTLPNFDGNLNIFTLDDYEGSYFSGYNGTHAFINNVDSFVLTEGRIVEVNKEEWESLVVHSVWDIGGKSEELLRKMTYIDRFGDLRILTVKNKYRIALKEIQGRKDYDIISKSYYKTKGEDKFMFLE